MNMNATQRVDGVKEETKVLVQASEVKRVKDSGVDYERGGVFEASKFAKGDGWR